MAVEAHAEVGGVRVAGAVVGERAEDVVVKNVGDVHLGGEAVAFADFAAVRDKGVGLPRVGGTEQFAAATGDVVVNLDSAVEGQI